MARQEAVLKNHQTTGQVVSPKNKLNDLTGREWVKHTKSWFVADGTRKQITRDIMEHPASYPPEAAKRFIRLFTKKGGVVLDPFAGCGSTLAAAHELERKGIGIELSRKFFEGAFKRINSFDKSGPAPILFNEDAMNADNLFFPAPDLIITSPPYWDMLNHSRGNALTAQKIRQMKGLPLNYSDDKRDIGNLDDYQEYLQKLSLIVRKCSLRLKPGGYAVIIIQNVREKSGVMRPVAWDLAREISKFLLMRQEMIWCQDRKRLGCWGYPYSYVSNLHHHYCLVFQKEK
jgi:DNA modification methylase